MVFYPPSDHISKLVRPLVRALKPYSSARDEFKSTGETFIYLDANENPNPSDVHRYPDPHQINLKNLIVSQKGLDQECLFLGNGSDEVLDLLVRAFIEPNQDKVIILPPTFGMYKVLSSLHGARLTEVPLDQNFQPDVAAILEATDSNTKLIFICSPNNPTGQTMDPDRIKILLERFPGLVVIDEAYIDFSEHPGYAKAVKNYDNLVVIQTFSKAYGLAGLRLGLCWAHPQVISYLKRIKLPYNVGELTQNRAKEVLLNPDKIAAEVAQICLERQRVAQALTQFDFIKNVFPSDANFLLFKVDDAEKRYAEMVKNGLVVRNTSGYLNLKNTLRLTIGTVSENNRVLEIMAQLENT